VVQVNAPRILVPELRKGDKIILRGYDGRDYVDLLLADPVRSPFGEGTRYQLQLVVTGLTSKPASAKLRRLIVKDS
jgi:hypothetical protein